MRGGLAGPGGAPCPSPSPPGGTGPPRWGRLPDPRRRRCRPCCPWLGDVRGGLQGTHGRQTQGLTWYHGGQGCPHPNMHPNREGGVQLLMEVINSILGFFFICFFLFIHYLFASKFGLVSGPLVGHSTKIFPGPFSGGCSLRWNIQKKFIQKNTQMSKPCVQRFFKK